MKILSSSKVTSISYYIEDDDGKQYTYTEWYQGGKLIDQDVYDFIEDKEEKMEKFSKFVGEPDFS